MKKSKIIGLTFGLLALLAVAHAEAHTHISFGFGANILPPPVYVQEYYPASIIQERVIVQPAPMHVAAGSRVYYEPVHVMQPVYRERVVVYPRPVYTNPMFSFRFSR
jgi:hypothetical protein